MTAERTWDQARWARERDAMRAWFPLSFLSGRPQHDGPVLLWRVLLNPYPQPEEMYMVLADLEADRPVDVSVHGRILHSADCIGQNHVLRGLPWAQHDVQTLPAEPVQVELLYRPPPAHPQVRCVAPAWSTLSHPNHPHFYHPDVVCPLFPPDGDWRWAENTAADYLQFVSLWALKTWVWLATARRGRAVWLGSAHGHSRDDLRPVHPSASCTCGSGLPFGSCCRRSVLVR